ncbi:MAG: hypothetical protein IPL03_04100 [Sterolibacteriaceae bacterium]|nr:hypothetical protein [Candidatus Methylophosphatis haderslevensis]
MSLGEVIDQGEASAPPKYPVPAQTRRAATNKPDTEEDSVAFFDETRVRVEVIKLAAPEAEGLSPDDFEVIDHTESYPTPTTIWSTCCSVSASIRPSASSNSHRDCRSVSV